MSTIKVDTIATRTGSGNITASNTIAGTSATLSGTIGVTGATTLSSNVAVNGGTGGQVATNFSSASTMGMKINDTNSGNLGGMLGFYSGSGAGTLRANIQNANNAGVHFSVGTGGSIVFTQTGYTAANALDDYEEGTWTPTAGTNAGTINTAVGKYTKVGRVVYVVAYIESTGMSTSGSRTYGGLPFAVNNLASQTSVDYQGLEWSNNSGGGIYFECGSSNFVNNVLNTFRGSFAATDNSRFQGFYFTD